VFAPNMFVLDTLEPLKLGPNMFMPGMLRLLKLRPLSWSLSQHRIEYFPTMLQILL
jgi:hypothetical protein